MNQMASKSNQMDRNTCFLALVGLLASVIVSSSLHGFQTNLEKEIRGHSTQSTGESQ